jgi:1,2-diacylglycerol 3-alpha-glucosyltransferase
MKIVILFINIGAYHTTRLNAAFEVCQQMNWQLTAVQITNDTLAHNWGDYSDSLRMPCKTLIPVSELTRINSTDPYSRYEAYSKACISPLIAFLDIDYPDVVCIPGWSMPVARAAQRWCQKKRKISLLMSESNEYDFPRKWLLEQYKRWIIKGYSAAIVGGQDHMHYLTKLGMKPEAIFFGYNTVNNDFFATPACGQLLIASGNPYFLAVSRFVPKKNLITLLNAYAEYRKQASKEPIWDLILCGDGPQQSEIEAFIENNGLQTSVHLPGFLNPEELLPYFSNAKCFVHASKEEQWGLVVNEAMAAGLPVLVSSGCGCFKDLVIDGSNGFGFAPENQKQLTALLLKMCSPAVDLSAMSQSALAHIKNFSPNLFGKGLKQAIQYAVG